MHVCEEFTVFYLLSVGSNLCNQIAQYDCMEGSCWFMNYSTKSYLFGQTLAFSDVIHITHRRVLGGANES